MVDYRTEFSVLLPLRSQEDIDAALKIYGEHKSRLEDEDDALGIGFNAEQMFGSSDLCLWSGGDGDTEHVIAYVRACAEALGLNGRWGFQWVSTCSRPRPGELDSGVIVLNLATGEVLDWMTGQRWLGEHLGMLSPDLGSGTQLTASRSDAAAPMRLVLQEALRAWSAQFDGDPQQDLSVSGADLVDWFSQWRLRARAALGS